MEDPALRVKRVCGKVVGGLLCISGVRSDFTETDEVGNKIKCRFWVHLAGKDPQSEQVMDMGDCSEAWLPVTTIETAQVTRQAAASSDKIANVLSEVGRQLVATQKALYVESTKRQQLEAGDQP